MINLFKIIRKIPPSTILRGTTPPSRSPLSLKVDSLMPRFIQNTAPSKRPFSSKLNFKKIEITDKKPPASTAFKVDTFTKNLLSSAVMNGLHPVFSSLLLQPTAFDLLINKLGTLENDTPRTADIKSKLEYTYVFFKKQIERSGSPDHQYIQQLMHCDWWVFPSDRYSMSQGARFSIKPEKDLKYLLEDSEFMEKLKFCWDVMLSTWGIPGLEVSDLKQSTPLDKDNILTSGQEIRLGKALYSMELLQQDDYYKTLVSYCKEQQIFDTLAQYPEYDWISRHNN
jgi:hypothetical protein